jgi:tetratricopeptide (TPR) repeat protein
VRFHLSVKAPQINPIQRALALAQRAIELAPRMSVAFFALSVAQWFAGDTSGSFASLDMARELNPNDTEIMAELGLRLALRMEWDRAIPLLEEAYARNPALPGTYRVALSLWHFDQGRFAEAYQEAQRIHAPRVVYEHVLSVIAAEALGDRAGRDAAFRSLLAVDPTYTDRVEADLAQRSLHPELIRKVVAGLAGAASPRGRARLPGLRRNEATVG